MWLKTPKILSVKFIDSLFNFTLITLDFSKYRVARSLSMRRKEQVNTVINGEVFLPMVLRSTERGLRKFASQGHIECVPLDIAI